MDVTLKRYLQRVADTLADKTGDDEWGTVDLERLYGWGVDPDRSVDENADDLLDESVEPHHVGQREAEVPKKSAKQLDAEIAEARAKEPSARSRRTRRQRQQLSSLQPVEGLRIPADARRELIRFWQAHPELRNGCLSKYGFDPIDEEADYWRFGLAEPNHSDVLRAVRRDGGVFSLAHVKRWEIEELRDV